MIKNGGVDMGNSYILYDKNDAEVKQWNLQERSVWYEHGENKESVFVRHFGEKFDVSINKAKEMDPTSPDLLANGALGDLKCQNTPLFVAKKYGCDPQMSVTFNLKDALAYQKYLEQSSFPIFFWVDWVALKIKLHDTIYSVKQMQGVWRVEFNKLNELRKEYPIHWYQQRNRNIEKNEFVAENLKEFEPRLHDLETKAVYSVRSANGGDAACSYVVNLNDLEKIA